MKKRTEGIHHISAIVGHPQENVDFYAGVLGLRLVKKTVNFDEPGTYHFYFGDDKGTPGTIITFFPWPNAYRGKIGGGQVGVTTYVIPPGSISFWEKRLDKFQIKYDKSRRFGEEYVQFEDVHGLKLELVERKEGKQNEWSFGEVTPDVAMKGLGGAVLFSVNPEATMETIEKTMGLEKVGEEGEYVRFKSYGEIGNVIDVKRIPMERGQMGGGTVHHIAWRAKDQRDHLDWQKFVRKQGFLVTGVRDRNYFDAIYFREHGDILFEIATDPPGFLHDESYETMGEALKLPPQYESYRKRLNETLIPIEVRTLD